MFTVVKNPNGTCEFKLVPDGNDIFTSCADPIAEITDMLVSREGSSITERLTVKADNTKPTVDPFEIKAVQSNRAKNVFTVAWKDGTVTSVHCQPGDDWDDEKALAMCFTKKALGNKGNFNDKFNDALAHMKTIPAPEEKTIPAVPVADKTNITIDEWRVVDRPAKVGDRVRLVTTCFTFNRIGDILLVNEKGDGIIGVKAKNHPYKTGAGKDYIWWYADGMYEVVEPVKKGNDAMADAFTRLAESGRKAVKSFDEVIAKKLEKSGLTEKINELCASASPVKTEANPWPKKSEIAPCTKDLGHRYNVYLYGIFTESNKFLFRAKTIEEVRKFISDDSKARGYGFYSRLWNGKENDLYIDYGSHTHYYHITGTNIEEYAYN